MEECIPDNLLNVKREGSFPFFLIVGIFGSMPPFFVSFAAFSWALAEAVSNLIGGKRGDITLSTSRTST